MRIKSGRTVSISGQYHCNDCAAGSDAFQKDNFIFYKESYYVERYGTMEEHLRQAGMWSTFAVVDENGWHEQGEMGWFGCSSETPEEAGDWTKKFEERFIKNCNPDDVLTVLDCHIQEKKEVISMTETVKMTKRERELRKNISKSSKRCK